MKSIVDVGAFECRWIEGDDDMCCAAQTDGGSWCPEHRAVVFRPLSPRPEMKHDAYGAAIIRRQLTTHAVLMLKDPVEI